MQSFVQSTRITSMSSSHSTPITTCTSMSSNTSTSAPFPQLFRCLHDHDWSQALERAQAYPYEAGYVDEHGMTALHYAASSSKIPVVLVKALLLAYPPSGLMRDYQGFTPLHYACSYYNSSPELILCLLEHAPSTAAVSKRDKFDKTPLHHLIQGNEFLMSKKIQAHHRRRRNQTLNTTPESKSTQTQTNTNTPTSLLQPAQSPCVPLSATPLSTNPKDDLVFSSLWRKATYLIKAAYHGVVSNPLPHYKSFRMLHACVATPDCPLRLVELVLLVHPEQATQMNEDGHIPIQIVAKRHLVSAIHSVRTTKEEPHLYSNHPQHHQHPQAMTTTTMTTTSLNQDYHTGGTYSNYNVQSNSYISSSSSSPNMSLNNHMNDNASGSASSRSATPTHPPTTYSAPTNSNSRFSFLPLPQTTTSAASTSTSHNSDGSGRRDQLSSPTKNSQYHVAKKAFNSLVLRPKDVPQRSKTTGMTQACSYHHPHSNNTQIVPQQQQQQMQLQQQEKRNSYKVQSEQSMAILWILLSLASAPEQLEHTRTKKLLRKVCETSRSVNIHSNSMGSHNQHHHMIGAVDSQHVRGIIQQLMMEGSSGTSSSSPHPHEAHSLQSELSMFPWRIVPMNATPKPPAPASNKTGTIVVDKEMQDIHNHLLALQKSRSVESQTHSPPGVDHVHHEHYHHHEMNRRQAVGAPPQAQAPAVVHQSSLAIPLMDPQTHRQQKQQELHRQREFQRHHPQQQQQQYHKVHVPSPKKTMPKPPSTPPKSSNISTTTSGVMSSTPGNKQRSAKKHHKNKLSVSSGGSSTAALSPFKALGAHNTNKNMRKQSKKAIAGGSTDSSSSNKGNRSKKSSTTKSSPGKIPTKPSSTSMRNMNNSPVVIMEQRQDNDTTANSTRRGGHPPKPQGVSPKKPNNASASVHSKQSQSRRDQRTIKSSSQRRHHHVF
jgi:hypothetical protein